jgi:hypothetical protein
MADLVAEFAVKGPLACKKLLTSAHDLAIEHGENIILSQVSDYYRPPILSAL